MEKACLRTYGIFETTAEFFSNFFVHITKQQASCDVSLICCAKEFVPDIPASSRTSDDELIPCRSVEPNLGIVHRFECITCDTLFCANSSCFNCRNLVLVGGYEK
jgi:hypothetical protein